LYVACGYATAAIHDQWRRHVIVVVMLTLVPCIGLWALIFFSLRQLRAEEAAWNHWKNEWVRRASAEASSRQLRRMGALGNLVARVAHDFNNLLMVVAANMELATRKNYTNVEREVTAVKRATVGAEALSRKLMSVARKQPLKHEVVDLAAWFGSASDIIGTALTERIDFYLDVAPDAWPVKVDITELESAILNVAVNARDAMPDGGLFSVRCANVRTAQPGDGTPGGERSYSALFACSRLARRQWHGLCRRPCRRISDGSIHAKGWRMCGRPIIDFSQTHFSDRQRLSNGRRRQNPGNRTPAHDPNRPFGSVLLQRPLRIFNGRSYTHLLTESSVVAVVRNRSGCTFSERPLPCEP
jgi:hypothetical protein